MGKYYWVALNDKNLKYLRENKEKVGKILNRSVYTIDNWIRNGSIPSHLYDQFRGILTRDIDYDEPEEAKEPAASSEPDGVVDIQSAKLSDIEANTYRIAVQNKTSAIGYIVTDDNQLTITIGEYSQLKDQKHPHNERIQLATITIDEQKAQDMIKQIVAWYAANYDNNEHNNKTLTKSNNDVLTELGFEF